MRQKIGTHGSSQSPSCSGERQNRLWRHPIRLDGAAKPGTPSQAEVPLAARKILAYVFGICQELQCLNKGTSNCFATAVTRRSASPSSSSCQAMKQSCIAMAIG